MFTDMLKLDLATVEPSLAGPKRPQDRVALKDVKAGFTVSMDKEFNKRRRSCTSACRSRAASTISATATW